MREKAISLLMKIAGEMVRGEGLPSENLDDWRLPKSTPTSVKRGIICRSLAAQNKAIGWARSIRTAIEILSDPRVLIALLDAVEQRKEVDHADRS